MSEALWKTWPVSTTKQVLGRQRDMEIAYLVSETGNYPPWCAERKARSSRASPSRTRRGAFHFFDTQLPFPLHFTHAEAISVHLPGCLVHSLVARRTGCLPGLVQGTFCRTPRGRRPRRLACTRVPGQLPPSGPGTAEDDPADRPVGLRLRPGRRGFEATVVYGAGFSRDDRGAFLRRVRGLRGRGP
jgi:hypothetical protein